jgi:PAS domain S-box-containing protein
VAGEWNNKYVRDRNGKNGMPVSAPSSATATSSPRGLFTSELRNGVALAVATVFIAWAATLLLRSVVPDRPLSFGLFFAAVAVSAGLGGLWAGVLATLLSALTCDYFFLAPYHSFSVAASDLPLLVLFIAAALLINGLSGRLRAQTRQADQRYYGLVQGLDGIVWEVNPKTLRLTFVSRQAEMLLGYPILEWLTVPDFRARTMHLSDVPRMNALWKEAVERGGKHTADYRAITADGKEVWIRETVDVLHDAHGRPVRMTGLGIDITDRKAEAEELLRMKDEFAVLNNIHVALSASLELPEFLCILQARLRQYLGVEAGCIFLTDDGGEDIRLVETWGAAPNLASNWKLLPAAAFNPAHDAGETGTEPPMRAIFTVSRIPAPIGRTDLGWTEALAIPLLAKDELRGVLYIFSSIPLQIEGERAVFYSTLGRQIGTLLQNITLYREVRIGRERLHQLSRQLVNVQENERRAIARELHDEIGQVLTGLKLALEMSARLPRDHMAEQIQKALTLVQDLIRQVEGLSLDLRPAMLDDFGLLPALHWHFKRYTGLTGVEVQFEHSAVEARFPAEVEITAYRIIQEALTNVARHAQVDAVTVRLWSTREILGLQVADQGRGFDLGSLTTEKATGGLTGMNERATLLHGHWTLETSPGMGTSITVDLPLTPIPWDNTVEGDVLLTKRKHEV